MINELKNNKTAADLKVGDTFKRQGYKFTVSTLKLDTYKNGTPCVIVGCLMNDSKIVDSFFEFKLTTKI
jgi:hypothetical protein